MSPESSRPLIATFALLAIALPGPTPARGDDGANLPRYRFSPGQEITYKGESLFKYGVAGRTNQYNNKNDWKVWVIRKNEDGSHRLIVRSAQSMTRESSEAGEPDITLAYCDIFDDGRVVPNDSFGYRFDPTALFPKLPANDKQAEAGWEYQQEGDEVRHAFKPQSRPQGEAGDWVFEEARNSPEDEIYLSTRGSTITFDTKRGLVSKAETRSTQGYGVDGKGSGSTELVSIEDRGADWTATFGAEADRYFQGIEAYNDQFKKAAKAAEGGNGPFAPAEKVLTDLRDQLKQAQFRDQVDVKLKDHERSISYRAEEAEREAKVVGKPAADWDVEDLKGAKHALKDYRGKVVILDFWYRGCGWCIKAMPQVKQLAADFRDRPVAVLGMNTDRKQEDAEFVIEKLGLGYPNLKAEGIPEKYGVQGFPTLVIIDQEGKVHGLHVGYSPTLRKEVAEEIEGLLGKE